MKRPVKYLQTDPRWGTLDYSAKGEKTNIAKSGCGPTCAAMVIASLCDSSVTPLETCKWSMKHGYKALRQGTYYSYFVPQMKQYGIKCEQINKVSLIGDKSLNAERIHKKIEKSLKSGAWVIAAMSKGIWTSSGHFVLAYKTKDGKVYINDPASEKAMRECNSLLVWQSQVKYYWIIDTDNPTWEEDNEVVTDRNIEIFGKEYSTKGIFKDGSNYLSPKVLADAGFSITSNGSKPIVDMPSIKVRFNDDSAEIRGFKSNDTNYCGIRELLEFLGYKVGWKDGVVTIEEVTIE